MITYSFKDTPTGSPTGYMAVFEPIDRQDQARCAATQNYFVSLDCWRWFEDKTATQIAFL